jgi:trk system potassium uptake protein TrkA
MRKWPWQRPAALQELDITSFDLVAVCMGGRLKTAVLRVHYLHQLQVPRILVKGANEEQAEIVQLVGATEVIHPEQISARKAALLIHHPRAVDYLELDGGHLIVAAHPPSSIVGKTVGAMAFQDRHGVTLLGLWQAGQQGPPSPPAPDRTIAETDVLILAGHIDRLQALRRLQ